MKRGGMVSGLYQESWEFDTVSGMQIVPAQKMHIFFSPDIYISPDVYTRTGKFHYYLGQTAHEYTDQKYEVSKETYRSEYNKYVAGGEVKLSYSKYVENSTVGDTIAFLAQYADPNYVSHFYSPSEWAYGAVADGIERGIVPWELQRKFAVPITRAEFCTLAANFYENVTQKALTERKAFTDTTDPNVEKIAAIGVVNGKGDGIFAPNDRLTRQEAAAILVRLADAMNMPLPEAETDFTDKWEIADWARGAVGRLQSSGIMGGIGDGLFAPYEPYTREQSIATIMRLGNTASVPVTEVKLSIDKNKIMSGKTCQLTVTVLPENATNKNVTFSASPDKGVYIDENGVVEGFVSGTTTITATASNGVSGSCELTVMSSYKYYLESNATIQLNNLYTDEHISSDFDFKPKDDTFVAGHITVTEATIKTGGSYGLPQITVKAVVNDIDSSVPDNKMKVYFKYIIRDSEGKEMQKGTATPVTHGKNKAGDEITALLYVPSLKMGEIYYIEFVNENA